MRRTDQGGIFDAPNALGVYGGGVFEGPVHGLGYVAADCGAAANAAVASQPCSPDGDCSDDWKTHVMQLALMRCENEQRARRIAEEKKLAKGDDLENLKDEEKHVEQLIKDADTVIAIEKILDPVCISGEVKFRNLTGEIVCKKPGSCPSGQTAVLGTDGMYRCIEKLVELPVAPVTPTPTPGKTPVKVTPKTALPVKTTPVKASLLSNPLFWVVAAAVVGGGYMIATSKKKPGAKGPVASTTVRKNRRRRARARSRRY